MINNWDQSFPADTIKSISTIKVDHNFTGSTTNCPATIPAIGGRTTTDRTACPFRSRRCGISRPRRTRARLTYDWVLSPTTLLNSRVGYVRHWNPDFGLPEVREYDPIAGLGLVGAVERHRISGHRRHVHADRRRHVGRSGASPARLPATKKPQVARQPRLIRQQHPHLQGRFRVA